MGIIDDISNLVTLGGHGRLQKAQAHYNQIYQHYDEVLQEAQTLQRDILHQYTILGNHTQACFRFLEKAYNLLGRAEHDRLRWRNETTFQTHHFTTQVAQDLLLTYSSVKNLAGGAGIGTVAALGSWALVSMLGTASTGTAIATLSGAAAFNATMAWFGGGALAVGGAGMAGGSLFLGGLLAIPMLAFATWRSYTQASEVEEEITKLRTSKTEIEKEIPGLRKCYSAAVYQNQKLVRASEILFMKCEEIFTLLFPLGKLSEFWRSIRSILGYGYFLFAEAYLLSLLSKHIDDFVSRFQGSYQVACVRGVYSGCIFQISATDVHVTIGSDAVNKVALSNDRAISSRHAEICRQKDGSLTVEDCESANGTFVNGARIIVPKNLRLDDEIVIGTSCLRIEL